MAGGTKGEQKRPRPLWVDWPPLDGLPASCEWQAKVRWTKVRQVRDKGVDEACECGDQDHPREGKGQMSQSTA